MKKKTSITTHWNIIKSNETQENISQDQSTPLQPSKTQ